jgi:predicted transcriptional regulator of viral defense system
MNKILDIFKNQNGYAFLRTLKQNGFHVDEIRKLLNEGIIEKVKPGLYKLVDMPISAQQGMIDICLAMPKAIICLHSALSYYELTTTVPGIIMVALPRKNKPVKIFYPPIQVFRFSDQYYYPGIEQIKTEFGTLRIYEVEKTVVDCFRFRRKLGEDIAREGLKNYLSKSNYDLNKLIRHAKTGRAYHIMKPYIEALITS